MDLHPAPLFQSISICRTIGYAGSIARANPRIDIAAVGLKLAISLPDQSLFAGYLLFLLPQFAMKALQDPGPITLALSVPGQIITVSIGEPETL